MARHPFPWWRTAGVHAKIAGVRSEYWQEFSPLPFEVVLDAGRKAKEEPKDGDTPGVPRGGATTESLRHCATVTSITERMETTIARCLCAQRLWTHPGPQAVQWYCTVAALHLSERGTTGTFLSWCVLWCLRSCQDDLLHD